MQQFQRVVDLGGVGYVEGLAVLGANGGLDVPAPGLQAAGEECGAPPGSRR